MLLILASLPLVGASAAIAALLWTSPVAFIAAVITWATNLHILYNASIGPYSSFKKWSLGKDVFT